MDPCFGEYITKEYGLLRQILSNLQPCDLHSAKLVCRDWWNAVETLVEKNPIIFSRKLDCDDSIPFVTKPILPELVIYHNIRFQDVPSGKKCKNCRCPMQLCPCKVCGPNTVFLSLRCGYAGMEKNLCDMYSFWQSRSVFMLSSSQKIKVSTFYGAKPSKLNIFKKPLTDEVMSKVTGGEEPIKGILVIARTVSGKINSTVNNLLNQLVHRQGMTFAVGGGICRGTAFKRGTRFKRKDFSEQGVLFITFRGDCVSAESVIIREKDAASMEQSLTELKDKAGDIPVGGTRIAFIAQCVDRAIDDLEKLESSLFSKYFPNVPQCGFQAFGEYGTNSQLSDNPDLSIKRKKVEPVFTHSYTTSILILTFEKI